EAVMPALTGHQEAITSACLSPDEKLIASASKDNTIILWNWQKGKIVQRLSGHTHDVNAVSFSSSGKYLVSASTDSTIKVWDLDKGEEYRTFSSKTNFLTAAFSQNQKQIISSSRDSLFVWDIESGNMAVDFPIFSHNATEVTFSNNDAYLLGVSPEAGITIWDRESRKEIKTYFSQVASPTCMNFSSDGAYMLAGGNNHQMVLWQNVTNLSDLPLINQITSFLPPEERRRYQIRPYDWTNLFSQP
ncbi:MAG: WD40 repeat domain-containing protein, partial [Bacteroidota bacterium]